MRPSGLLRGTVCLVVVSFLAVAAFPARASAQERKGFVIGFGGGFGYTNWGTNHSGVFTNIKIGYAPTNRFAILWHSASTTFKANNGSWMMDGMAGGSIQIFLSKQPGRGGYVIGGAGYHNMGRFQDFPYGTNDLGFGIRGGFGYEFAKRWTVETLVQHGFHKDQGNPTSLGVTVNWLFY